MKITILSLFALISGNSLSNAATDKIFCYYGSWAVYREANGKFDVEDLSTDLCTHIIYTFLGLSADGSIKILDSWNEIDKKALERFVGLKSRNPNLKLMIAIGGWNEGSSIYSSVTNNPTLRANLVTNIVKFLQKYKLDGFDLDWEYPAQRGGISSDRQSFISLMKDLRPIFNSHGWLLTAAVAAAKSYHSSSYDVIEMNKYLDYINVMSYDLHGSWDKQTGQNAPLYSSSIDISDQSKQLNVDACIKGWIESGATPSKLILGMGTYGRSFTLSNENMNKLGAPAIGAGTGGRYTQESGFLGYNEICESQRQGGWNIKWDDEQKTPYAYKNNQWVGYDNVESIKIKSEYARDNKLGGAMIWSIETDDFKNVCGEGKFPILQAINNVLRNNLPPQPETSSTAPSVTTTTETTSTIITGPTISTTREPTGICAQEGYIRDPNDCGKFYYCQFSGSGYIAKQFNCPPKLYYDNDKKSCNWEYLVKC